MKKTFKADFEIVEKLIYFFQSLAYGSENKKSIGWICNYFKLDNRIVRQYIEYLKAVKRTPIAFHSEGGYFQINPKNKIDVEIGKRNYISNRNRAMNILENNKVYKQFFREEEKFDFGNFDVFTFRAKLDKWKKEMDDRESDTNIIRQGLNDIKRIILKGAVE